MASSNPEPARPPGGYPPRRQSMSITSLGPIPTPGIPPAAIGLPPNQPSRRQSLSAVPPRGPPPLGQLGMKPPDGVGPNSLNRRVTVPQLPKGLPPRGPPPRGPPPRGPPHGPPGFNNDRSSLSDSTLPDKPMMPQLSPIRNPEPQLSSINDNQEFDDSSMGESMQPKSGQSSPRRSEVNIEEVNLERNRALSSAARSLSAIAKKRDDPSLRELATEMQTGKLPTSATNEPQPTSNALGKPPPHIHSQVPPIPVQPQHAFGKLVVCIIRGINLRAVQGVFGRADPYVKLIIGDKEFTTSTHKDGGKSPEWKEEFEFEITTERWMEIEVIDKEVIGDDKFMGAARVGILDWIAQGNFEGVIELVDKLNRNAGQLEISASFYRHGTYPQRIQRMQQPARVPLPDVVEEMTKGNVGSQEDEFTEKEIIAAFQAFDLDKNNYVGAAEIRHVLLNIGERPSDEEVDEMIRMVDKNGDGQVAFDEFYRMVTGGREPPPGLRIAARQSIVGDTKINIPGLRLDGGGGINASTAELIQLRNTKRKALDKFARDNYLKPESIKRAHRRFQVLDKKKSGVLDYTEFCEVLQTEPSIQCEEVFKMYDYNQSGLIDAKELLIALANFSGAAKDDKMKFAFMMYDEESTGSITHRELVKILRANHMAKSEAEVARKAETIIASLSKNDGTLSFDDFVVVSKKFPNILFPTADRPSSSTSP